MGDGAGRMLTEVLREQDGVVSRRQVLACGFDANFVRTRLRRGEWVQFYRGVYVTHTGEPSWRQRAWAATLDASPAALSHESALQAVLGRGSGPIHIAVDASRSVGRRPGVVVHYRADLADVVQVNSRPPRVRVEDAVVDLAAAARTDMSAVARLSDAVQERVTTADRLIATVRGRSRISRRTFLCQVLVDVRDGSLSVLEHGYATSVERAHGLPTPVRQPETESGRRGLRDVLYKEWGLIVELDGRLFHDNATAYDADLEWDLDAAVWESRATLRVGIGQVFDRACTTAHKVGLVLNRLGWPDRVRPCTDPRCSIRQL